MDRTGGQLAVFLDIFHNRVRDKSYFLSYIFFIKYIFSVGGIFHRVPNARRRERVAHARSGEQTQLDGRPDRTVALPVRAAARQEEEGAPRANLS